MISILVLRCSQYIPVHLNLVLRETLLVAGLWEFWPMIIYYHMAWYGAVISDLVSFNPENFPNRFINSYVKTHFLNQLLNQDLGHYIMLKSTKLFSANVTILWIEFLFLGTCLRGLIANRGVFRVTRRVRAFQITSFIEQYWRPTTCHSLGAGDPGRTKEAVFLSSHN